MNKDLTASGAVVNAMTVDVEDYFQVSAFEPHVSRDQWDSLPARIQGNTDRILFLFAEHGVRATFFVLGWVAERYQGLIRRIVDEGHELASHGYAHRRVGTQGPDEFRQDVIRTKHMLEDIGGCAVRGYRAASFSIGADTLWALDILRETGYQYSSSIYPVSHDHYGMPNASRFQFRHKPDGLLEIPITTAQVLGRNLPIGGGGYFRLCPYSLYRWALHRVNVAEGQSGIFYFHPWELDPDQPRPSGIGLKTRFRHYVNLQRMEGRMRRLLSDFEWGRMDHVFLGDTSASPNQVAGVNR